MGRNTEMRLIETEEMRLVNESALEEARKVIDSLYRSQTSSGQYMATGGELILQILGLKEVDE